VVGLGVGLVTAVVSRPGRACSRPAWVDRWSSAALGAGMLGALGLIAGLWADKFDQIAAFQNFIIMPMTFLSGVFYSVHVAAPFWQAA
jgi:ABC-2 type transport system permease protein